MLAYDATSAPKPFLHPLRLPDGTPVTEQAPTDHPWHRGLWFAIKFVDGINYWEENEPGFGSQRSVTPPVWDGSLLRHHLRWEDTIPRLDERRTIRAHTDENALTLDWESVLTPLTGQPVVLDRTPFTTWGGYGGLFIRLRNDLDDTRLVFPDGTTAPRCTGERHAWAAIEGVTPEGQPLSVVFTPEAPEPFYGSAQNRYHFFGPAPLFEGPLTLAPGSVLRYRVHVALLPRRVSGTITRNGTQDNPTAR